MLAHRVRCLVAVATLMNVASAQSYRYALTLDRAASSVDVFDLDTLASVGTLVTGGYNPCRIVTTPDGTKAYVLHKSGPSGSADIAELDLVSMAYSRKLPGTILMGDDLRVSPNGRWLIASSHLNATLFRYDLTQSTAPPLTLELAPAALTLGTVEVEITADSRYAFVNVGTSHEIVQVDLASFQVASWVSSNGAQDPEPVDLEVITLAGTQTDYLACWIYNSTALHIRTWDPATGVVGSNQSHLFGQGWDLALDPVNMQAAITGEFLFSPGLLRGMLQTWDLTAPAMQGMIISTGSTERLDEVIPASGVYYAVKPGAGVQECSPNSMTVTAEYSVLTPTTSQSSPVLTRDEDLLVFSAGGHGTSAVLVVVDRAQGLVAHEAQLASNGVSQVVIAECTLDLGVDVCNGDGGDQLGCTSCLCGNDSPSGTTGGCLNSAMSSARLLCTGDTSASIPAGSSSDLRFAVSGAVPSAFAVLRSGGGLAPLDTVHPCFGMDAGVSAASMDGLQCAASNMRQHGGRVADISGSIGITTSPWGGEGNPVAGLARANLGFSPGETRYFQVTYREHASALCQQGLNTTQAVRVTFCP